MHPAEWGRLWRTVRHLRPIQIVGRAHFLWHRPRVDASPAPALRPAAGGWVHPAARAPSMLGARQFRFLSEIRSIDASEWDNPSIERLWRYNLHYFDDLSARGAEQRRDWHRALVADWLIRNPPPSGTGWEPYPVSLRIVNWIKWFLAGQQPDPAWLHSLAVQARWLRQRLEWHLLGNHLFANAKALVFAGLFFEGSEAQSWLETGIDVMRRELPEQFLEDGGHFERSTMYHALALEDVLDLLNMVQARAPSSAMLQGLMADLRLRASQMLHWLRAMSHPDGGIGLFNDAAHGIAPDNAELEAYARVLGIAAHAPPAEGITALLPSGYVRCARGAAVALLDTAPIGPDYLVGHAHADTLSFELSLHGRRVIVNGGTSCYGLGAQRLHERGTSWHSTVQIAEGNSSEVWSGFRVGRRARITSRAIEGWSVQASHDGWRALPQAPTHTRCWQFERSGLRIVDRLNPKPSLPAVARYHLAPGLELTEVGAARWRVTEAGRTLAEVVIENGTGAAQRSTHAPRFGELMPAQALIVTLGGGMAVTHWTWTCDAHPLPY